ncbi:MAG: cytochrome c553 [Cellvibrionaceae bacterium]|jgi:cytochrome c553
MRTINLLLCNALNGLTYRLMGLFLISGPVQAGMIDKETMAPWEICGLCHSLNGISPTAKFPTLAGQKAAYIKKQFIEFNQQIRTNGGGQMVAITTEVDVQTIDAIANYFSALSPPPAKTKDEVGNGYELGKVLFTKGRGELPACITCHGSPKSPAPWLYAQHGRYLIKQLSDFKSGHRLNDEGETMRKIASMLREQDMAAIAGYLEVTQPR